MPASLKVSAFLLAGFFSPLVFAEVCEVQDGYDYRANSVPSSTSCNVTNNPTWHSSPDAAAAACTAKLNELNPGSTYSVVSVCSQPGCSTWVQRRFTPPSTTVDYNSTINVRDWEVAPDECPTCDAQAAASLTRKKTLVGNSFPQFSANFCDTATNCRYERSGGLEMCLGSVCFVKYSNAGDCSQTEPAPEGSPQAGEGACVMVNGVQTCVDLAASENCGTVNGEYMCLGSAPEGSCVFLPGGSYACDEAAPELPVDGNDVAIPPDATLVDEATGGEWYVWLRETISAAVGAAGDLWDGVTGGGGGSSPGSGGPDSQAVEEGVANALEGLGAGDAATEGEVNAAGGGSLFGGSLPTVAAPGPSGWDSLGGWMGGDCPAAESLSLMGSNIALPYDAACNLMNIIGFVIVAVAMVVGARIVIGGL